MRKLSFLKYIVLFGFSIFCDATDVEALVKQLGADSFAEREAAVQSLWEVGDAALPLVRIAAESMDPEVKRRAMGLLPYLERGVRPDWPAELREQVLNVESLSTKDQQTLMKEMKESLGLKSLSFLLLQLKAESSRTAKKLIVEMLEAGEGADQVFAFLPDQPDNEDAALVLAEAYLTSGKEEGGLLALKLENLPENAREKIISAVVDAWVEMFKEDDYQRLYDVSATYVYEFPRNARFMYLKGVAAAHLGNMQEASGLSKAALQLDPEEEAAHFKAGELLGELRQDDLAAQEWVKILNIPPKGGVYDINAYNRLGDINRRKKDYERAANAYGRSLALFRKAKAEGNGMGMLGASEEDIEKLIRELRAQAVTANMGNKPITNTIEVTVKGDRMDAYKKWVEEVSTVISFEVQPYGFRLLEKAPVTLNYVAEKNQLELRLNGNSMSNDFAYEWKEGVNRVIIRTMDMRYIYELNREGEAAEKIDSFELDYLFKLQPTPAMEALTEQEWTLDGESVSLEALKAGIHFDYLPEAIEGVFKGVNEQGARLKADMKFKPKASAPKFP